MHLRSYYKEILGPSLGIESALKGFRETIHNPQYDPFGGNPLTVLQKFFEHVTPETLADELLKHVKNAEDLAVEEQINEINKQISQIQSRLAPPKTVDIGKIKSDLAMLRQELEDKIQKNPDDTEGIEDLESQISSKETIIILNPQQAIQTPLSEKETLTLKNDLDTSRNKLNDLKKKQHDNVTFSRPISTQNLIDYVQNFHKKALDEAQELENKAKSNTDLNIVEEKRKTIWGQYFTLNEEGLPTLLHKNGAYQLLMDLGYIIAP